MDIAQPTTEGQIRQHAIALAALGHNGLVFSTDVFDRQRYKQAKQIAADLLTLISNDTVEDLQKNVYLEQGYMTPKVDVRGGVFDEQGRILLIRDRSDEKWTLPGGWCDVLEPPSLAVEREVEEESGLAVRASKLVALHDRDVQGHQPAFPYHVYKLFFLCETISHGRPSPIETMEVGWFDVETLPELSTTRVLDTQIRLLHEHWDKPDLPTVFD
ncbi:NUDIX hydrolase [Nocardia ignorata]|uniref:ADP-ribose pyrophosphatase YjhB (NUDIX family) n=1 Tax=Nocardia ignorata TaxID=145285 RepID=A0A4R6NX25_NOCIG|nr:NUDIX hydrolase N-terminal domain-containing protein [Nocardia ignorata]TDP28221.1 ADP-ribose pyrophosphatase YjhB (NUDIX family) [Nocardia ignorata]